MKSLKEYVICFVLPRWRKERLMRYVATDVKHAKDCCLMDYPNAFILNIYREVKL